MITCGHEATERFRVCRHLLETSQTHLQRFTGHGVESEYVCDECRERSSELRDVCAACRDAAADSCTGIVGAPEIVEEASDIRFVHRRHALALPAFADMQPVLGGDRNRWIGVTHDRQIWHVDFDRAATRSIMQAPDDIELDRPMLRISRDARYAAIANRNGTRGALIDLDAQRVVVPLLRDGYCAEHCEYPMAFVERGDRHLFVHSPLWNRLDIIDAATGDVLTPRESPSSGEPHNLDYFHCGLTVSPDQAWIVDNGWVWHPVGMIASWSIERWLENAWESEDGPSRRDLCWREYFWDGPLCWIGDRELAVYGYGSDDDRLIAAARIFDVETGRELRWFAGPTGDFVFDRELYAIDDKGVTAWHAIRGTCLARHAWPVGSAALRVAEAAEPNVNAAGRDVSAVRWHPTARVFVSATEIISARGGDARAEWNTNLVADLAREHAFEDLPVLGDALEAAGCTDAEMLAHCHDVKMHADRCWVLDRLERG